MNTQTAAPSLSDEIERKSFEAIDYLFSAVENGKISKAQFKTGIDTLFLATGGLVSNDIFELITQANKVIDRLEVVESRHFVIGEQIVTLQWIVGSSEVKVLLRKAGLLERGSNRYFDCAKDAYFWYAMHGDSLAKKGIEL